MIEVAGKYINLQFFSLKYYHRQNKYLNFDVQMILSVNKTKKSSSKLKLCQSIFLITVVMGKFQGVLALISEWKARHNDALMIICKAKYYQEKTGKTWSFCIINTCRNKCTTEPILVNRDFFLKKQNFDQHKRKLNKYYNL